MNAARFAAYILWQMVNSVWLLHHWTVQYKIHEFRTERRQVNKTQQKTIFSQQRNDKIKQIIYKKSTIIQAFVDERLLSREQSVVIIGRKQQTASFVPMSSGSTLFL